MERFTRPALNNPTLFELDYKWEPPSINRAIKEETFESDAINKLGRLEDFEQNLGIDFLTFVKSLVKGVYVKTDEGIINYKNSVGWIWKIGQNDNYVGTERPGEFYFAIIYGHDYYYYLKDYGKTWALAKEELQ